MADGILDKRLIIVTGKGGVGKSTVSAALALCAVRQGKRVLVCELGAKERIATLFGAPGGGAEVRELEPGLNVVHVQPKEAMREYGLMKLKFQTIYNAVFENRLVRAFLRLIPSLAETVMLGKVWFEVEAMEGGRPRWDLVILDAPATGHGVSLLRVPEVLLDTVPPGPLREDARRMKDTLVDPERTSLQIVALPEEMPVNESLELHDQVRDVLGIPLGRLFLNAWVEPRFEEADIARLTELYAAEAEGPLLSPAGAAAGSGLHHHSRARLSDYYRRKLEVEITDMPLVRLPRLYTPTWGRAEVEALSRIVERALGEGRP